MKFKDLTGSRIGNLTILEYLGNLARYKNSGRVIPFYRCRCDCGQEAVVRSEHLSGQNPTKSCGCGRSKFRDKSGEFYGSLEVIEFVGYDSKRKSTWRVKCKCGRERVVSNGVLLRNTKKCVCIRTLGLLDGSSPSNDIIRKYKNGALRRNLGWNLSDEETKVLLEGNCHYCGIRPQNMSKGKVNTYIYSGIDRVDNNHGYFTYNVVSCCRPCNFAKGFTAYEDFVLWLHRIALFHNEVLT